MSTFNQQGQQIHGNQTNIGGSQYNSKGDLDYNAHNDVDLITYLERLWDTISQADEYGRLSKEMATVVEYQMSEAIQDAQKPVPDKQRILHWLHSAKSLVEGVTATSGMVTAIVSAIEQVQKLF